VEQHEKPGDAQGVLRVAHDALRHLDGQERKQRNA
jgi:hypothetical protein